MSWRLLKRMSRSMNKSRRKIGKRSTTSDDLQFQCEWRGSAGDKRETPRNLTCEKRVEWDQGCHRKPLFDLFFTQEIIERNLNWNEIRARNSWLFRYWYIRRNSKGIILILVITTRKDIVHKQFKKIRIFRLHAFFVHSSLGYYQGYEIPRSKIRLTGETVWTNILTRNEKS